MTKTCDDAAIEPMAPTSREASEAGDEHQLIVHFHGVLDPFLGLLAEARTSCCALQHASDLLRNALGANSVVIARVEALVAQPLAVSTGLPCPPSPGSTSVISALPSRKMIVANDALFSLHGTGPGAWASVGMYFLGNCVGILEVRDWVPGQHEAKTLEDAATLLAPLVHLRQADEEHRADRSRLDVVLETIPDAVALFDANRNMLLCNGAARDVLGANVPWQSGGQSVVDASALQSLKLLSPALEPVEKSHSPLERALANGTALLNEEYVLDLSSGRRRMLMSVFPVAGPDGRTESVLMTARDVTEQSERNQRKDEFLSLASHELRNPLTPLIGLLQMACRQALRGDGVDTQLLVRAEQQSKRLRRLIDSLLDVGRLETGKLHLDRRTTDLGALMQRTIDPWHRPGVSSPVHLTLAGGTVLADVDPDRIDQVVTNLIDNAVKHSSHGTAVQVSLGVDEQWAVIRVRDSGVGIEPEVLVKVFERFFQGKHAQRHQRSLGLGLYICRELIEAHGGRIEIESQKDQFTLVTISLPLNNGG